MQFYETDAHLSDVVSRFLGDGLVKDEVAIVIATEQHRAMIERGLTRLGVDTTTAATQGRLILLDAREILARIVVNDMPHEGLFDDVVGRLFRSCAGHRVRAYGEMVDLLWQEDKRQAALRLEELWNGLCERQTFSLLCAYVIASFYKETGAGDVGRICEAHSHVVGLAGDHAAPAVADPAVTSATLALPTSEVERRIEIEHALRQALAIQRRSESEARASASQLQVVTDALPALIGFIDADQRYRFVNQGYQRWLGRPAADIIGRHVRDVDGEAVFERLRPHIDAALAGNTAQFQTWLPVADGGRFVESTYVPRFDDDGVVQGFTVLVADATDRRRADEARHIAAVRAARLMKVTGAIADAVTTEQVYEAVVERVADALGASSAGLWRRDDDGVAVLERSMGYAEATRATLTARIDSPVRLPILDVLGSGEPLWIGSQAELLGRYPHLAAAVTAGPEYRIACLPVVVLGQTLGALAFTFEDAAAVDADDKDFLLLIARYAGQALERLRLLDAERRSRAQAEATAARMGFLSRASRRFCEAGDDLDLVMRALVQDITATWADACAVLLTSEHGDTLEIAALDHRTPGASELIRSLLSATPMRLVPGANGAAGVALTGVPVVANDIDVAVAVAGTAPEYRAWVERHAPRHVVIVPLVARGKLIGAIEVLRNAGAPFSDDDKLFFQDLADRAGLAIESGRLHHENERARLRAELLYGLARALIGAPDVSAVFDAALDAIELTLGTVRSAIIIADDEGVMRFRRWRGLSDEYRAAIEALPGYARSVVAHPAPMLSWDVDNEPAAAPYLDLFRKEGIRALVIIPLVAGDKVIGRFVVYYTSPRVLEPEEIEVAVAIANHVAAAVSRFAAVDELRQTVRFNEMFTGMLGHDLRNPLNAIMTAAELLLARGESERVVKPVARILNSGHRMARMIDQLLDFTRVRLGVGIPLFRTEVDVGALVREVMGELDDANPDWVLRFEEVGDAIGCWDGDRLAQVFSNLVANAVQHGLAADGVDVRLDGTQPDRISVEIVNSGVIPEALLPRLFEPMTGGERRGDKAQGLGLGLYITQEIVRGHGGSITVDSSAERGTRFTVSLPRRA